MTDWQPFFKYGDDGMLCLAQQTYEPLISPDRKTFCANYDWQNKYQRIYESRELYTEEVCTYFFKNEVYNLLKFKDKAYTPVILDIDQKNKKIFFEWNGYTFNEMLYNKELVLWHDDIEHIILDLYNEGVYKLTLYPHCHYLDKNGIMKTIDWYGCIPVSDPFIPVKYMDGIIHETARFRLEETGDLVNGCYNLKSMFKQSLKTHVKWADKSLEYIYNQIHWID
jgi:hypothetical protein